MRRLFLILLLCPLALYAQTYRSNMLGQRLEGAIEDYRLEDQDGLQNLYKGDELVFSIQRILADDETEVRRTSADGTVESWFYDGDGRLVRSLRGNETRVNIYLDGRLASTVVSVDGEPREALLYFTSASGHLIATQSLIPSPSWTIVSEGFLSSDGYLITEPSEGLFISQRIEDEKTLEVLPSSFIISTPELRQTYSLEGYLIEEQRLKNGKPESSSYYSYDEEGSLKAEIIEKGQSKVVRSYDKGSVTVEETYQNGILEKRTSYSDAIYVDLMENGMPYARVKYALDGRRVLDIQYY
ncbi:MAG: hypothetical protein PHI83_03735 [Sphaerochaetaceae bacterium]|jgi:YD repeat-containing protein|nr:hypothetical protein [Sphaerochaetaceae bacterium]